MKRSSRFYGPFFQYLGYVLTGFEHEGKWAYEDWTRFERETPHEISICQGDTGLKYDKGQRLGIGRIRHIAFCASDRNDADRFYSEILVPLEKKDLCEIEDPPCDCPEYDDGYYATFFFDPDELKYGFVMNPNYFKQKKKRSQNKSVVTISEATPPPSRRLGSRSKNNESTFSNTCFAL